MNRDVRVPAALSSFVQLIDLEKVEEDLYRGVCHPAAPLRAFGGQVAAQALLAAGSTVAGDRPVHSLHGYFIRPGRTDMPIVYQVDRIRDGGSFTTRNVVAVQNGEVIFSLSASFHRTEDSVEHQADMPDVPEPGGRPTPWQEIGGGSVFDGILERVHLSASPGSDGRGPRQQMWVRAGEVVPDTPLMHACALTYISDVRLASTAGIPHLAEPGSPFVASLDHSVWFHRPFRADEWLLADMDSPNMSSARGLSRGQFFTRDGRLAASVAQETLFRRT